jgi:hypothetical protein
MTIILDGTTGITTPAINSSGDLELPGGTANGVLYLNGSKVATSGSALVFDGTNLGVGVTPSAWGSFYPAIEANPASGFNIVSRANDMQIGANFYQNNSFQNLYGTTGQRAAKYVISAPNAQHLWYTTETSGTAGNTITFGDAKMLLTAEGNLGVGTTSPGAKLQVSASVDEIARFATTGTGGYISFYEGATRRGYIELNNSLSSLWVEANVGLRFATNNTERARITSAGAFVINRTSAATNSKFTVETVGSSTPNGVVVVTPDGYDGTYDNMIKYGARQDLTASGQQLDRWLGINCSVTAGAAASNIMRLMVYSGGASGAPIVTAYFDGAGDVYNYDNSSSWNTTSDLRIKQNIKSMGSVMAAVLALRPVEFDYTEEFSNHKQWKGDQRLNQTGFIAQEYEAVLPSHVSSSEVKIGESKYEDLRNLNEGKLIPYLVKAIQELKAEIDQLKGN